MEFKKNFNFNSLCEYGKILSSMANNNGGYIVFGVTENRPHEICGMSNDQFERIEPSKISNLFNEHFSPQIQWDHSIEVKKNIKIGFLFVEQSKEKPVICVKCGNRGEYDEGEIYFRYPGKTSLIKPSDLQAIINDRIEKNNLKWQNILGNIAKTSPSKAAILNTESGKLIGDNNIIVVDKDLLSDMKFIKKGEFNRVEGTPVYKIVGEIKEIDGAAIVEREKKVPHIIHKKLIINAFLDEKCNHPKLFLKQFPYENTCYLPFWFFIKESDLSIDEVENIWNLEIDSQSYTRIRLLNRLKNEDLGRLNVGRVIDLEGNNIIDNISEYNEKFQLCKSLNWHKIKSELAIERSCIYDLINNDCSKYFTDDFIKKKSRLIFEAISNLDQDQIIKNKAQILELLKKIQQTRTSLNHSSNFRKSICHVDCMLYRDEVYE